MGSSRRHRSAISPSPSPGRVARSTWSRPTMSRPSGCSRRSSMPSVAASACSSIRRRRWLPTNSRSGVSNTGSGSSPPTSTNATAWTAWPATGSGTPSPGRASRFRSPRSRSGSPNCRRPSSSRRRRPSSDVSGACNGSACSARSRRSRFAGWRRRTSSGSLPPVNR